MGKPEGIYRLGQSLERLGLVFTEMFEVGTHALLKKAVTWGGEM